MDFEPKDQQVIELLTKLRNQGGTYPKKMLASRRQMYLNQIVSVGAGLGIGTGIKAATKAAKTGSMSFGSIVETVLVVVIVAQSGVIAYKYRDKIIDLVNSLSPIVTPTALSIPVTGSSVTEAVATETPLATDTITETATTTETPEVVDDTVSSGTEAGSTVQDTAVAATPKPTKDVPGNHYGQTPKPPQQQKNDPKPTKENGNGGNSGNNKKP